MKMLRKGCDLRVGQKIAVLHNDETVDGIITKPYGYESNSYVFTSYEDRPWLHAGDDSDSFIHRHWIIYDTYTEGRNFIIREESLLGIDELI